jgi:hypothetical protein
MKRVSGFRNRLNSTFYLLQLSKTHVAYGAGIPYMQEQSKESSNILIIDCNVLISFMIFNIVDKVTNIILPKRKIGAISNRVLCNACTIPLMKINLEACPVLTTYLPFPI